MPRASDPIAVLAVLMAFLLGGCAATLRPPTAVPAPGDAAPAAGPARDAYVLLSGGGSPLSNNYSQYLQAKALAGFLGRECPPDATWVFFGVGNRDDAPPVLADARREQKRDGRLVQTWVPGALARNRPATKESFLQALRKEILPRVRDGGTLYLFVGDHGELIGPDKKAESAITLWQLKRGRRRGGGWYTDDKEVLGVAELRQVLAEGLGRGRVVFGMTQCHSGGFHELGVAREMMPPRAWFHSAPDWAAGPAAGLRLRVAGFTAVDQDSPAAGCDADPDPERWAGYERFFPEGLLGIDLMSGATKGPVAVSLAEAHEKATLIDHTIDAPRTTSEHYLERWAHLIESKLATTLSVTSRTQQAVAEYQRAVDRGLAPAADPALRVRQEQFARFTAALGEQVPAVRSLLLQGTRAQLEASLRARGERGGGGPPGAARGGRRGAVTELRKHWNDTLRPAWKAAVLEGGAATGLGGAELAFEKHLLGLEDKGRNLLLTRGGDDTAILNEIYWESGYADPAKVDRVRAEAVARWGAERRARIVAWGQRAPDPAVRAAAEKIGPGPVFAAEEPRPLSRKTAVERVLFYRRVLAAWAFLIALDARPQLAELHELIEIERTPLRPAGAR